MFEQKIRKKKYKRSAILRTHSLYLSQFLFFTYYQCALNVLTGESKFIAYIYLKCISFSESRINLFTGYTYNDYLA